MEKEEREKGNKLISDFMGHQWSPMNTSHQRIDYDNSWNWLIPVVEKIESLGWECVITKGLCHIFSDEVPKIETEFANKSNTLKTEKIILCWKTVIDFINFYNSQNQK